MSSHVVRLGGADHLLALLLGDRHRLLAEHVDPRPRCCDRVVAVQVIRQGDVNGVHARCRQRLGILAVRSQVPDAVLPAEAGELHLVVGDEGRELAVLSRVREGGKDGRLGEPAQADDRVADLLSSRSFLSGSIPFPRHRSSRGGSGNFSATKRVILFRHECSEARPRDRARRRARVRLGGTGTVGPAPAMQRGASLCDPIRRSIQPRSADRGPVRVRLAEQLFGTSELRARGPRRAPRQARPGTRAPRLRVRGREKVPARASSAGGQDAGARRARAEAEEPE